ncbi:hypothetical protein [Steroidobacter cummioxidans]|uniref:hypothetical protein n=1 Tax=Steroidobacter cummioxidans TaxID=1803913 RepID=UPI000E322C30|nr:hypothetical protein [Steroidobacter cummioxidans]
MKRTSRIAGLTLLAATFATMSPATAQGPGWTVSSTVVRIVNTANGGVNVRLSPDLTGCTSQSGYGAVYASIYPDHPGLNRMKADLLVAFTTGMRISVYLSDATCTVGELTLDGY